MPSLRIHFPGKEAPRIVKVAKDAFTIGRAREADVCLPFTTVSKRHVAIERKGGRFVFQDLGSTNGVLLNGFKTRHGALSDGDEIQVGTVRMEFWREEAPPVDGLPPGVAPAEDPLPDDLSGIDDLDLRALDARGLADPGPSLPPGATSAPRADRAAGTPGLLETTIRLSSPPKAPAPGSAPRSPPQLAPSSTAELPGPSIPEAPRAQEASVPPAGLASAVPAGPAPETRPELPIEPEAARESKPGPEPESGAAEPPEPDVLDEDLSDLIEESSAARARHRHPPPGHRPFSTRAERRSARSLSPPALILVIVASLGGGLGLGYLASWLDPPRARLPRSGTGASLAPDRVLLGGPADLQDPATALRLAVRLCLDRIGRPPLREERNTLRGLPAADLWLKVDSLRGSGGTAPADPPAPPESATTPTTIDETAVALFRRLLAREPEPWELKASLAEARNDLLHLEFTIATSAAYAAEGNRRPRAPEQLARSFYTDILDRAPTAEETRGVVEALRDPAGGLPKVAELLLERAATGPSREETPDAWCREAWMRLLLRAPSEPELEEARRALSGKDGWKRVLLELAMDPAYLEY